MPGLVLPEEDAGVVAAALNVALYVNARNGVQAAARTRRVAVKVAAAVPEIAVKLPSLLDAAGPQAAATVKAEARRLAASRVDAAAAGPASSDTAALLSSRSAARIAGVTGQAIRAACADGRLVAAKHRITGAWRIAPAALDEWITGRRNAA
jgi:hypothetical protein